MKSWEDRGSFEIYATASAKSTGIKYRASALLLMSYVLFSETNITAREAESRKLKAKTCKHGTFNFLFRSYFPHTIRAMHPVTDAKTF